MDDERKLVLGITKFNVDPGKVQVWPRTNKWCIRLTRHHSTTSSGHQVSRESRGAQVHTSRCGCLFTHQTVLLGLVVALVVVAARHERLLLGVNPVVVPPPPLRAFEGHESLNTGLNKSRVGEFLGKVGKTEEDKKFHEVCTLLVASRISPQPRVGAGTTTCVHHTDVPTCLAPQDLLDEFLKLFDFSEMSLDEALR